MGLDIYFLSDKPELPESEDKTIIGYFRKFNALFRWVDQKVAEIENCEDIYLSKDHFLQLQSTLSALNFPNCHISFPTQEGFFFGSTEYDDLYWEDVRQLRAFVDKQLAEFDFDKHKIYFNAWW